jgi:hypothetical protein
MQVLGIVLALLFLIVAVRALRRGMVLWRSDRRLPKNLVFNPLFSREANDGFERAVLPMAAGAALLAAVMLVSPPFAGGKGTTLTGTRLWVGVIAGSGMVACVGIALAITYFNRPRWMVPPFMRSELGITTAWWRGRSRRHGQRRHG